MLVGVLEQEPRGGELGQRHLLELGLVVAHQVADMQPAAAERGRRRHDRRRVCGLAVEHQHGRSSIVDRLRERRRRQWRSYADRTDEACLRAADEFALELAQAVG